MAMHVIEDGGVQLKRHTQLARTQDISQEWHTSFKLEAIVSLIMSRRLSYSSGRSTSRRYFRPAADRWRRIGGELVDVGNALQRRKAVPHQTHPPEVGHP